MVEGLSGVRSDADNENVIIRHRTACTLFKGRWSLGGRTDNDVRADDPLNFPDVVVQIGNKVYAVNKEDRERFLTIMRASESSNVDFNVVLDTQAGEHVSLEAHGYFESMN